MMCRAERRLGLLSITVVLTVIYRWKSVLADWFPWRDSALTNRSCNSCWRKTFSWVNKLTMQTSLLSGFHSASSSVNSEKKKKKTPKKLKITFLGRFPLMSAAVRNELCSPPDAEDGSTHSPVLCLWMSASRRWTAPLTPLSPSLPPTCPEPGCGVTLRMLNSPTAWSVWLGCLYEGKKEVLPPLVPSKTSMFLAQLYLYVGSLAQLFLSLSWKWFCTRSTILFALKLAKLIFQTWPRDPKVPLGLLAAPGAAPGAMSCRFLPIMGWDTHCVSSTLPPGRGQGQAPPVAAHPLSPRFWVLNWEQMGTAPLWHAACSCFIVRVCPVWHKNDFSRCFSNCKVDYKAKWQTSQMVRDVVRS